MPLDLLNVDVWSRSQSHCGTLAFTTKKYVTCSLNERYLLVGFSLFGLKPECLARRGIYKHHQMLSSPRENTRVVTRVARAGVWLSKLGKYLKSQKLPDDKMLTNVLYFTMVRLQLCAIRGLKKMNIQHPGQSNSKIFNSGFEKRYRSAWVADDMFSGPKNSILNYNLHFVYECLLPWFCALWNNI